MEVLSRLSGSQSKVIDGLQQYRQSWGPELRRWHSALAGRNANVVILGDSISEGYFASTDSNRWIDRFRVSLQRSFGRGGIGWVPAAHTIATPASPWVGVSTTDQPTYGLGHRAVTMDATTDSNTLTFHGDRVWILYVSDTNTGGMSVTIDGVTTNIDTRNAAGTIPGRIWDSGPLARRSHTVAVKPVVFGATTNQHVILEGAFCFDGDTDLVGMRVWDGARASYSTANFNGSGPASQWWASYMNQTANVSFADGASTNASHIYSSATANFNKNDVGRMITGTNIQASTWIQHVYNPTQIFLSKPATATGSSLSFTITSRIGYNTRPDLVIIMLGANDLGLGTTIPTFKANIEAAVNNMITFGSLDYTPSILLVSEYGRSDSGITESQWLPYRAAMEELANKNGYAFLDLYSFAGYLGNERSYPITVDGVHPTDRGMQFIADEVCRFLGVPAGIDYPQPIWTNVAFDAAWTNTNTTTYDPVSYYKDSQGMVWLRGLAKRVSTTGGGTIFTLPAEVRPSKAKVVTIPYYDGTVYGIGQLNISATTGVVSAGIPGSITTAGYISFDGLVFTTVA